MCGKLVGIVGPTATGKTAVGIELARMLNGEIISADSMAVYRGMDIGTAKPTAREQSAAQFHLIDVVDPDEEFSAAEFRRLAECAISDIEARGKLPVVVGGTGLYVKALTGDLNIPVAPPDWTLRTQLAEEAQEMGKEHLLERLREVDPQTASRLHANDLKRIIRALEVYASTGKPISYYHQTAGAVESRYDLHLFGLTMSRAKLYERIEQRIDEQLREGFVDEVRGLLDKGYDPSLPSMGALGYKQIAGYLRGEYNLDTAVELFKRDTRRFAKRQLTWFRADTRICWIDIETATPVDAAEEIARLLEESVK